MLVAVLAFPRVGGADGLWMNGLYEALAILFIFPLIIYLGAGGTVHNKASLKVCKFFGDISYPIYITHYPLIYIYTAYVIDNKLSFSDALPVAVGVLISAIIIAYASLKLYDEPVRKWLKNKVGA